MRSTTRPEAFVLKILFTAVTIGAGFKGGEIVATFFIGATFGCTIGSLLGLNPGLAAAIGLVSLFCGVVNCPIASFMLGIELFGAQGLILFAIACAFQAIMAFTAARKSCIPSLKPNLLISIQNRRNFHENNSDYSKAGRLSRYYGLHAHWHTFRR